MSNRIEMNMPKGSSKVSVAESEVEAYLRKGYTLVNAPKDKSFVETKDIDLKDVVEAIGKLDTNNDFTASGKPKVTSIEKVLGANISSEQRDEAWDAYSK